MRRAAVCSVLFLAASSAQVPESQSELPRFEVASIRPSNSEELAGSSGCQTTSGLIRCTNVTLKRCIVGAYVVGPDRVLGGPDWTNTDHYQITARAGQPINDDKALMAMLQTLLAERFKLVLHRESRRGEAMVLEVAKNGPKLQLAGDAILTYNNRHDRLDATTMTMAGFAEILSRNLNLPVVDRTGLTSAFNFTLRWNPDSAGALERDDAASALRSEVSNAIARQLGLTLKSKRMPVEVLVIDHAAKPSEN
jgi:uncharacterized protein (TIGR03435 family)